LFSKSKNNNIIREITDNELFTLNQGFPTFSQLRTTKWSERDFAYHLRLFN
jgi:hypothetical protein